MSKRLLAIALYMPLIITAVAAASLLPILPFYGQGLTASLLWLGLLLGAQDAGQMLGNVPSSTLIHRFGMKATLLMGTAIQAVFVLLLPFSNHIALSLVLLLLSGSGFGITAITRQTYIAGMFPKHQLGRVLGMVGGMFRIGRLIGPALGGVVASVWGIEAVFAVFSVLCTVSFVMVWIFLPNQPTPLTSQKKQLWDVWQTHRRILMMAGIGQVVMQMTRKGWLILIPLFGALVLQLPIDTIGYILSIAGLFDVLFFVPSGFIMDRLGRKWAIIPSLFLQGIGIACLPLATTPLGLTIVASFINASNGISSGTMMTVGADLAPEAVRSEFLSLWRIMGDASVVVAPLITGVIAEYLVLPNATLFFASVAFFGGAFFWVAIPETLPKQAQSVGDD
ncbi:MAG: MFS transporter [Phototrophicaceae bacterium]